MDKIGKVIAISIGKKKGIKKTNQDSARLIANHGIEGDAHAGKGNRQISLLSIESINKIKELGLKVNPGDFAENITTEDIDLMCLEIGDLIEISESELEITQIGKECHSRCSIFEAVGDCVMPKEGIFATVHKGGIIKIGDIIKKI